MASRAEPPAGLALPTAPSLGGAVRAAAGDAYYHSWRLLPANVVWAAAAILVLATILVAPLGLLLIPLLALPTAGVFRVTTRIARGASVSFWDAVDAWRTDVLSTLAIGIAVAGATAALGANVVTGLASGSPLGWGLATLAGWGLVALWLLAWTAWPILLDPDRADRPVSARLRLAALLVLAHPLRVGALALALALFLAASTVAVVALGTISVAFAALVASRYVLPAADRLEARISAAAAATAASATAAPAPTPALGDEPLESPAR